MNNARTQIHQYANPASMTLLALAALMTAAVLFPSKMMTDQSWIARALLLGFAGELVLAAHLFSRRD